MKTNIMLCGVGGQGILFAAKILASAAELSGYKVTTNELHGMAQRGGSVTAQVRFGDDIHSPLFAAGEADVLCGLEPVEALRCAHFLKPGGFAVISRQQLIPVTVSTGRASYPQDLEARFGKVFTDFRFMDCNALAAELGDQRLANTVLLGALSVKLGLAAESWRGAFERTVKPQLLDGNLKAFAIGAAAVDK